MINDVKIGKYTLESLTTGMYSDPKIIYREYIQNSVDSLDEALKQGFLNTSDINISIIIDQEHNKITIYDNGVGIKASQATKILTDIGNSRKTHTNNRGFRGIGRLGGLSYCKELTFTTSFSGESKKSIITFDCKRFKELLIPGQYDEYDLRQVINDVTMSRKESEKSEKHYFKVEMDGVDEYSNLLDIEKIESYIRQVAPLPYDNKFTYANKINRVFKKKQSDIGEYPIFIGSSTDDLYSVFKPNKSKFISDATKKLKDEISEIIIFDIIDENEDLMAIGWYGDCSWYGSIVDKEISGLRVRKGNILIGDSKTLGSIFREERFNGWTQGEIFVLSDKLIPNARRDDFEQNDAYYFFMNQLIEGIGNEISLKIRRASKERNSSVEKKVKEAKKVVKEVETINKQGFNSEVEKKQFENNIKENINNISKLKPATPEEQKVKEEAIGQLEEVLVKTEQSENFKFTKVKRIGEKELEVLKVVSNVLSENLTKDNVDMILNQIIKELNGRGRKNC